jgi:hypothetical protein
MTLYATLKNGNQTQIKVYGDQKEILKFIESYKGEDLGNDLILQDFVTDFEETGVVIEK